MSRKVADSEKIEWNERHDLGLSGDAIIAAFDDAATLPMEHGAEPTYTMQQAIDAIVGGLTLEWVKFREFPIAVRCETFAGRYMANEENCWFPGSAAVQCNSVDHGKQLCLEDYKSRFRAEIERAVKRRYGML